MKFTRVSGFLLLAVFLFLSSGLKFEEINSDLNSEKDFDKNILKGGEIPGGEVYSVVDQIYFFNPDSTIKPDSTLLDSTNIADTTIIDSLLLDPRAVDSTARLKHFRFDRSDKAYTEFNKARSSAFFVYPSGQNIKREVKLDSTEQFVLVTETIAGIQVKPELKIPIDEYVELRRSTLGDQLWSDLGYEYVLNDGKTDLSDLLSDITNIEIPLPETSFLSIFGPPKIALRISGSVDIHGAWRNETTEGLTASALGNSRNEPDFKQQVQINVSGTIGDKLTIGADWNTERTFEYENQLKIKYEGYEDEIIQSVEAGNVSLRTSPLVGGSEALFGVKAKFQMGPFTLTALASQKKSEVQEKSVSGGSQKETFEIRAYDYATNHFFIDQVYADSTLNIFNNYFGKITPVPNYQYQIKQIEVWKTVQTLPTGFERKGSAFIDLEAKPATGKYPNGRDSLNAESRNGQTVIGSRWIQLVEGQDYDYHPFAGFVTLKSIQDNEEVAVAYRLDGPTSAADDDKFYGDFVADAQDTSQALILKLIKPKQLKPSYKKAWNLQLKNIYPIGGRDIDEEGFKFDIRYIIEGQEPVNEIDGVKLLQAFQFDQTDASKTGGPDGEFDYAPSRTINTSTGEIIFPVLQPFNRDLPEDLPDNIKYSNLYDTTKTYAQQNKDADKFLLTGEYTAAVSSVINIGFNVVENSVKVLLGGRELKEGVDYRVDYNIGQVTIMNDAALVTGADLKISYEQNDLFQLASKTLLGLRGEYEFNKKTSLGFSFLNLNEQTLSDKVRIGEEPLNNTIFGLDFKSDMELPFITKGLDQVFSTKQMSTLSLKGEFAYINPDPNTKKSNIQGDNDLSIAYVDDFEGAKRIIPIGVSYGSWKDLSPPDNLPEISKNPSKLTWMRRKAKSFWYNALPSNVTIQHIWGDSKQASREDQQVTVLDYVFRPGVRGQYNYNPNFADQTDSTYLNWGGAMKLLSSSANNLVEENIEFIEFWMLIEEAPDGAKLNIDLGQITEDLIPNGRLDSEDKNLNALVDEGEDTGIDGIGSAQERTVYTEMQTDDPSGDNFIFGNGNRYAKETYVNINGTEGNAALTDIGRLPDTEDLNNNFTLDRINAYFRYEVPLDTIRERNNFVVGGGAGISQNGKKWYQFRIPLKEFTSKYGQPGFDVVELIRIWISGVEEEVHIRLAEFNLVGNQWQKILIPGRVEEDDSVMTITTINVEDNPEYYPPADNLRERDRTKPDENIFKNEQSLNLQVRDLNTGERRDIIKYLFRPLDLFNYREMKLFVHGPLDESLGSISWYENEYNHASDVYIRFGSDTSNYYEYRQPIRSDWEDVHIIFSELTAIKELRDDPSVHFSSDVSGRPGHKYGVRGNPALTKVKYFQIGIENTHPSTWETGKYSQEISGDIWVNEMRVLGADDSPGWAYSASTSLKLADLITINANVSQTDPYFHRISERFGSRQDKKSWSISTDIDVIKLLPFNMAGSNFRVNYSHNESKAAPLYLPGTDVKVSESSKQLANKLISQGVSHEEAQQRADDMVAASQTMSVSDTWTLSGIQLKIPSKKWYIRDTFNSLKWNFNYNKAFSRNPTTIANRNWTWNAGVNYSVNFDKELFFYPVDIPILGYILEIFEDYRNAKVYFAPTNFSFGATANRKYSFTQNRNSESDPNINRDFTTKRNFGFSYKITEGGLLNLSLNYSSSFQNSLAHLLADENGIEIEEKEIWNAIFDGEYFGKSYSFSQQLDFKLSPQLPKLWSINKFLSINARYSTSYQWKNNFQQEDLGRSAGYSSNMSAGITLRLKSLVAPLFAESQVSNTGNKSTSTGRRGGARTGSRTRGRNVDNAVNQANTENTAVADSTESVESDSTGIPIYSKIFAYAKTALHWMFFDYEQLSANFSQTNSYSGGGLKGEGNGFSNFWGFSSGYENGPNRSFMLGLNNKLGQRAINGNLSDNYSQKNTIDFKTKRPLWEDATIDISWKVGWGVNRTTSMTTDEFGNVTINNITSSGNIDRSFLSLPPFFGFSTSGIQKVHELYSAGNTGETGEAATSLSSAFTEGMEALPLLSSIPFFKDFAKYIPRPNWKITWSGLEKLSFLDGIAKRASINHAYNSQYTEGWKMTPDGVQQTQTQKVIYGFAPLIGLNMTFDDLLGGDFTGSLKYSLKSSFDLGASTKNITESFSKDINFTASFSKSGFEIPLFGLSLKNDLEISFSYTSGQNSVVVFDMNDFKEDGTPQDGTTRISMEPRVKYVMSSKVTLSLFYKRTSVQPEGASRIPPTTTNEAGLDVHISIQ